MKNLKADKAKILLIGIGNTGRSDDGLGWKFVELISNAGFADVDFEFRYQLQIEDALLVSRYDKVVFVDSSHTELDNGFVMQCCLTAQHYFFSSHIQTPETILYLASELYNKTPEAYTLAISAKDWRIGTVLSKEAEKNLQKAVSFFEDVFIPSVNETNKTFII